MPSVMSDSQVSGSQVSGSEASSLRLARFDSSSGTSWRRVSLRGAVRAVAATGVLLGLTLALGACTKCDVPDLTAPRACHGGPAPQ